ncbi:protein phosphatase regulator [Fusarium poae]
MAAVLPSEDNSYFAASSLRRSHSHSTFISSASPYFPSSHLSEHYQPASKSSAEFNSSSTSSSPHTAHADSVDLSYSSTPTTNLPIASDYDTIGIVELPEGNFMFPSFAQEKLYVHPEIRPDTRHDDNLELPPSPREGDSYAASLAEHESSEEVSHETSGPETLEHEKFEHAEDDTAVSSRPSRQVDYLSHEWREEDIWSSWRYVVTRRGEFPNSARLENASWRAWIKAKNNLKTIPPESINWLKDCDVTWLYGPLQSGPKNLHPTYTEPLSVPLSNADSLLNPNKKSILKKRSISEVMFQRSLSTASLLKQATAAVKAQETRGILRLYLGRSSTDCFAYPFASCRLSEERKSIAPSVESSRIASPSSERKHIHFNEQVKQCIAIEAKDNKDMINDHYSFDSDLDHGVMIRRVGTKKRPISRRKTLKPKLAAEGKTIAMLPSTTLKYREDTPESQETAMKHSQSLLMPLPLHKDPTTCQAVRQVLFRRGR